MPGGMEFDFSMRGAGNAAPRDDTPFSLLLLGHYGDHGSDEAATAPVRRVDIDTIDALWERFEPGVDMQLGDLQIRFEPRDLDHFHPDHLVHALPAFQELRHLRKRLVDPDTAQEALEEVLASSAVPEPQADEQDARPDPAPGAGESGEDMFSRLLGDRSEVSGGAQANPPMPAGLDALIRSAVAPHIVHEPDPRADAAVNSVDLGLADLMRQVLRDPGFQALEARWRGLYRLVQNTETDETLEIRVCNITHQALLEALPATADGLEDSPLFGLLVARHRIAADDRPPSVIAVDHEFGPEPDDLALLGTLGVLADAIGASLLAGAQPGLVGAGGVADLNDARQWAAPAEVSPAWTTLREAPFAPAIGLVLPRRLARLPYGASTDPVSAFEFEELPSHDAAGLLWSCAVPDVCALLLGLFTQEGWSMSPGVAMDIEELPAYTWSKDGEAHMQPGTEQLMPESALGAALERGVMPLAGFRNQDRARLVRIQSIASPLASLKGPWND